MKNFENSKNAQTLEGLIKIESLFKKKLVLKREKCFVCRQI